MTVRDSILVNIEKFELGNPFSFCLLSHPLY